ncbi:Uncharacterised protein [Serratia liquefaciens]|nr:Uncharacterised protein [Serratia liquefaciens]
MMIMYLLALIGLSRYQFGMKMEKQMTLLSLQKESHYHLGVLIS